ncbi:mycofactocin precursor [Nocardia sp. FDAARGOS_372]|nr:mycofactocin precursor [Nocardia sp. FDAARGOS_372]
MGGGEVGAGPGAQYRIGRNTRYGSRQLGHDNSSLHSPGVPAGRYQANPDVRADTPCVRPGRTYPIGQGGPAPGPAPSGGRGGGPLRTGGFASRSDGCAPRRFSPAPPGPSVVLVVTSSEEGATVNEHVNTESIEQDLLVEDVSIDGMCGVY